MVKEVAMMWGGYGWGMGYSWLYMIVFWAIIITAIAYLVKSFTKRSDFGVRHEAPLDILKRRYAKGEITREEFERMRDDVKKS
jgi:putative membrane protein